MAKEISELSSKTTPVGTDEIEIQETGGGTSKKTTLGNLWAATGPLSILNLPAVSTTITSGGIARAGSFHKIDTEGGAATDSLFTISDGVDGDILVLTSIAASKVPTIKDADTAGSGNINLAGGADFELSHPYDKIVLIFRAARWDELTRSNNS